MKVGILTYHRTTNYGAMYQSYALQRYINKKGVDCEVIDYNNKILKERYDTNPFKASSIKQFIKRCLYYKSNVRLQSKFNSFMIKNIRISKTKYDEFNIKNCEEIYDKFIAGSDQIWNMKLSGNDKNYFMDFCNDKKKKNSYAASIGITNLNRNEKKELCELIKDINNISVRENQGKLLLESLIENKEINQNIDPVFLLSKRDWLNVKSNDNIKQKYILVYEVAYTERLREFANLLEKRTGYKIYFFSASNKKMHNAKNISDSSPEEFLNYIYNAEYVITSSFHGFALSIIFEKEVYYDIQRDKNSFSSRIISLANLLNLEDRLINCCFDKNDWSKINYKKVKSILEKEKNKSYKYIDSILEIGDDSDKI